MNKLQPAFDALTDLEETMMDMRAVSLILKLTAEQKNREGDALSFIGRQLDDWERRIHAAFETLTEERRKQSAGSEA